MIDIVAARRELGWLILWALVPMPFLYIVLPLFWMVAGAAGISLVLRPEKIFRPSNTLLNLAAVAIVVVVAASGGLNIGPLRPLGHLLLLLTAVQVLLVHDRRSFLRSLALVGMVWVVSVASSTHVMIALYFLISAAIGWWFGIRLHLASLGIAVDGAGGALPRARHVIAAVAGGAAHRHPVLSRDAAARFALDRRQQLQPNHRVLTQRRSREARPTDRVPGGRPHHARLGWKRDPGGVDSVAGHRLRSGHGGVLSPTSRRHGAVARSRGGSSGSGRMFGLSPTRSRSRSTCSIPAAISCCRREPLRSPPTLKWRSMSMAGSSSAIAANP